jgi:hypothetical protein
MGENLKDCVRSLNFGPRSHECWLSGTINAAVASLRVVH